MRTPTPYVTLLAGAGLGLVLLLATTQPTRTNAAAGYGPSPAPAATSQPSGSGSPSTAGGAGSLKPVGPLPAIPGCDSGIASAPDLGKVEHATTAIGGRPVSAGAHSHGGRAV